MKKVIFLILFLPFQATCQIVENFESGSLQNWVFSQAGRWSAVSNSLSGNFSLGHTFNNSEGGADQAGILTDSLHPAEDTARWSFLIRYGCDPSSSNNWSVFLMSDTEPSAMLPGEGVDGYAAGVNMTGYDDTLRIWKVKGSSITSVVTSKINWQNNIGIDSAVRIFAERTPTGKWKLSVSRPDGKFLDTSEGSDNELLGNHWFGIFYKYTSTRDRLLWIDDITIQGRFYEDNEPPVISRLRVAGTRSVEVSFSEEPSPASVQPGNFTLNGAATEPVAVRRKSAKEFLVIFSEHFLNKKSNSLGLKELCDKAGNCSENVTLQFIPVFPEPGDVVINEIMADPVPTVSLPPVEYVEITNLTTFDFNMKNWKLEAGSRFERLPDLILRASTHLIICSSADTAAFKKYGFVTGLKQFPPLSDTRMILSLSDSTGNMIHCVEYDSRWIGSQLKASGGWSVELKDAMFPFYEDGNWAVSVSRSGGTPGMDNSVAERNPDEYFRGIMNTFPKDSLSVLVKLSEYAPGIDSCIDFFIDRGIEITNIAPACQLRRSFLLHADKPLQRGLTYRLEVAADITDFAGNTPGKGSFDFGIPDNAQRSDMLFNELLFNSLPGDPDYIELYNNSDKIIDASTLWVASVNTTTGDTSSLVQVSEEQRCIMPQSYYAITTDISKILNRYPSSDEEFIFRVNSLPAMNDESGHLILLSRELDVIDNVTYNSDMHYSLLKNTEGIALEKIVRDGPSSLYAWHSASESSGWGTPGAENSADIQLDHKPEEITFSSTKITPDNNGFEDALVIDLSTNENGNIVTITIFDETGSIVRKLTDRFLAAPETSFIWDGNADDGTLVSRGIYIVFIEMYNSAGKVRNWKKVCTVIR